MNPHLRSSGLPEIIECDTVLPVDGSAPGQRDPMEQRQPLGFGDLVHQRFRGHHETVTLMQEKSPAGRQFMSGDDPGIGDDPEEISRSPSNQSVELCVGIKTSLEPLDVSERSLVSLVARALEVDAVIFLEERVAVGDRSAETVSHQKNRTLDAW